MRDELKRPKIFCIDIYKTKTKPEILNLPAQCPGSLPYQNSPDFFKPSPSHLCVCFDISSPFFSHLENSLHQENNFKTQNTVIPPAPLRKARNLAFLKMQQLHAARCNTCAMANGQPCFDKLDFLSILHPCIPSMRFFWSIYFALDSMWVGKKVWLMVLNSVTYNLGRGNFLIKLRLLELQVVLGPLSRVSKD